MPVHPRRRGSLTGPAAPGTSNRSLGADGEGGTQPKLSMYLLCQDEPYKAGTTTCLQDSYDIDELRELGAMIEQVHHVCDSGSTNFFTAKVTLTWSVCCPSSESTNRSPATTLQFSPNRCQRRSDFASTRTQPARTDITRCRARS